MKLIDKVLLGHDFSKPAQNVVATAIEIAKIFHAEILPIHVLPNDIENEKAKELLKEAAAGKLDQTIEQLKSEEVKVATPILDYGSPHTVIAENAINKRAGLILIGSGETQHGEKFMLGTTAQRIIQQSEKPVLVVKENVPLNVQHILCPVDFSSASRRALKNAITMAHRFKSELTILGVCEIPSTAWFASNEEKTSENNRRYKEHSAQFDQFLSGFNLSGLKWNKVSRKGKPAEEILNTISEKMIDLLIIGTTGKTNFSRMFIGSVAEKVIREVPCSFLTLKSEDIITLQLGADIRDIEHRYQMAQQLTEDGFFDQAIEQFKVCLSINNMHVPSYYGLARAYEKLGEPEKAQTYKEGGREIMDRIWDQKIEDEVRKLKRY
jgi:nucleotide-binding universal stress UspA family protein